MLAQEVRQAAPRCVGLFAPEENYLQTVLRFLRSEVQETPLYLGDDLPAPTPTADQLPSSQLTVCLIDHGKLHRLSPKKPALLCP